MNKLSLSITLISFAAALLSPAAHAQATDTLKKIKERGSTKESGIITLGVRDSSIPFSYLDDKQSYQGYSVDICTKIATALRRDLGLTELKMELVPVTSSTRIPLMANGTIDLECGSTTNNLERQKQVAFAPTTFVVGSRILSKKSSKISSLSDLKGKQVVSTAGTTSLKQLTILNADKKLDMTILTAKDHSESFLLVETGRAVAFVMDDILLASQAANSKAPGDYVITKEALSLEPYGIMMRKDDPAFKAAVDKAVIDLIKNGEIKKLYAKWFLQPIPPKSINLNWPVSPELQAVFDKPTDSGDPAAYGVVPEAQKVASSPKKK